MKIIENLRDKLRKDPELEAKKIMLEWIKKGGKVVTYDSRGRMAWVLDYENGQARTTYGKGNADDIANDRGKISFINSDGRLGVKSDGTPAVYTDKEK